MNAHAAPEPSPVPVRDAFAEAADLSNAELQSRLVTLAGQISAATGQFLVYLGAFDLADGWHGYGVVSCAHWLSWHCGMSLHAAREQVRVARRLRDLPVLRQAMLEGRVSFSKARALTRVATPASEADLVVLAVGCSAAQLDKICRLTARALSDEQAQDRRNRMRFAAAYDTDGMLVGSFRLPPEEGAVLMAAIDARLPDRIQPTPDSAQDGPKKRRWGIGDEPAPPTEGAAPDELTDPQHRLERSRAAAVVDVARAAMAAPGEDGPAPTVADVIIHVDGTQLDRLLAERATLADTGPTTASGSAPAPASGSVSSTGAATTAGRRSDRAAAGGHVIPWPVQQWNGGVLIPSTKKVLDGELDTCCDEHGRHVPIPPVPGDAVGWVEDGPGLALATVERLLCDASVRARCGHEHPDAPDPRARREPSRAQRRALWRRDRGCRAPGCTRTRGLHAHHIIAWWLGGPTILANLVLLCSQHHHLVHEGGWTLTVRDHRVVLTSPDGKTTLVEAPRTQGSTEALATLAPTVDEHTLTRDQHTDGCDYGYAVSVVATNIDLFERLAAQQQAAAEKSAPPHGTAT